MTQSIADILDRAADLIEPEGRWIQGQLEERDDRGEPLCFCMVGAIHHIGDGYGLAEVARDVVAQTLGFANDECADPNDWEALPPVPEWNDAPERTQAEVVAKLREAAALAREQGK